jgi:hypothetical protein
VNDRVSFAGSVKEISRAQAVREGRLATRVGRVENETVLETIADRGRAPGPRCWALPVFDKESLQMRALLKPFTLTVGIWLFTAAAAEAKLFVKVDDPTRVGDKAIIKLTLKNTFSDKVKSARATLFLMNDEDKVVGQKSEWIIGGTKDKPGLAPNESTTYNFVVQPEKPFTKTKLIFNRIILDGGKQVDPIRSAEIEGSR